jgi:hypothetical protein
MLDFLNTFLHRDEKVSWCEADRAENSRKHLQPKDAIFRGAVASVHVTGMDLFYSRLAVLCTWTACCTIPFSDYLSPGRL